MAIWEKNPENSKFQKALYWYVQILAVVAVFGGIHGLYRSIPVAMSPASVVTFEKVNFGWAILTIIKSVLSMVFGLAILVYYKKSLSFFSCYWIFIPFMIYLPAVFLRSYFYYDSLKIQIPETLYIVTFLGFAFFWLYFRKKYPDEFGLRKV